MYGPSLCRQPLLPAKHHKRRRGSAPYRQLTWALAALAALAAVAVLLYRWAPQPQPEATSEEEQRDSEHELHLLHEQPSDRFCQLPPPLVCAHGGDINAAPPNTAAAFAAALDGGARCVEVDVARTRDGQLVVLHARELQHLLHLAGAPPHQQQQPSHRGGHGSSGGSKQQQAQVQAGEDVDEDVMAQQVLNLVRRTACRHCLIWAKSDAVVHLIKGLDPQQQVGYVVMNETAAARAAGQHRLLRMLQAEVIALHFGMASQEVTQQARAARKRVHAWTANTAGMMRAVLDAGVDAVVTNHPRKLMEAVESRARRCRKQGQLWQQDEGQQPEHRRQQQQRRQPP